MKIAIYQPWIYLHGGIERTLLEIMRHSRHEWVIYTGFFHPKGTFPEFAEHDVQVLKPTNVNRSMRNVLVSAWRVARQRLPLAQDVDAIVVSCDGIGDLITVRNRDRPILCLCFTPLRAAFDPVYEAQARTALDFGRNIVYSLFKNSFRFVDRLAWRAYKGVIAISGEVRDRVVAGGLAPASQISLAYPGINWSSTPPQAIYDPIITVTGRIMWTKNIELAIKAFLAADVPANWKLVIAGYVDEKSQTYLAMMRDLAGGDPRIEFMVSPSDAEMEDLQRRASFSLFTPRNEDWGIVPLEAMALGKPVIAVNSGGPRESIEDGVTGYLLPPEPEQWAEAITRLVHDPELVRQLGTQAHQAVGRFSWERFAADLDVAIERYVLGESMANGPQIEKSAPQLHAVSAAAARSVEACPEPSS